MYKSKIHHPNYPFLKVPLEKMRDVRTSVVIWGLWGTQGPQLRMEWAQDWGVRLWLGLPQPGLRVRKGHNTPPLFPMLPSLGLAQSCPNRKGRFLPSLSCPRAKYTP